MNVLRILPLLLALPLAAQTQTVCGPDPSADKDPSLGDFARQHRAAASTKHATVTLNEEDLKPIGPFPDITLDEQANDISIAAAYRAYIEIHTRVEIDNAVHDWYDRQVAAYNARREEVARIQSAQQGSIPYYPQYYADDQYDPQKAREQNALAQAGMQADQRIIGRNQQEMSRITSALQRLRSTFDPKGGRYDWFNTSLYQQRY
ncbi:hypothetical protein Acid345_4709 [Candidatus Koribacter versatilis Ellin345]|uniref:Uncharacterized protein n=1 Tax=Koribacter versatilis (strain Ellin345) TaxID=204669 RepID=Q1IHE1_KORVE|nr:hypothetical protein [Candidatus Koribacter versatilis]ABF43709.1 hypothetical protein Acid345_4709 [Candidatus Koribacter versatilis Ellin345]